MNVNSLSHQKRHTQGATLIVVVILTMLTLLAILFITMNLSMGMRRTTEDQRQTLPAQFAAEAGVATAQAQLGIFQALSLNPATSTSQHNEAKNLDPSALAARKFPLVEQRGINMTGDQLLTQVRQLCAGTNDYTADPTPLPNNSFTINNKKVKVVGGLPNQRQASEGYGIVCQYPENFEFSPENLDLMRNVFVVDREGGRLDSFYKDQRMDEKTRNTFLKGIFGSTVEGKMANNASYRVQSGIKPIALFRAKREVVNATKQSNTNATTSSLPVNVDRYGLLFTLKDIDSTGVRQIGQNNASERRQVMRSDNTDTMYFLEFSPVTLGGNTNLKQQDPPSQSFSVFALFVHDALQGAPLGDNTVIDGRMHTNSSWQFHTDRYGTGFLANGLVTSAGCEGASFNAETNRCNGAQRSRMLDIARGRWVANPSNQGQQGKTQYWGDRYGRFRVGETREPGTGKMLPPPQPNLAAAPIKLPADSTTQQADANSGGITIPTSVKFLNMNSIPLGGKDPKTGADRELQEFAWTPGDSISRPNNPTCTLRVEPGDNGKIMVNFRGQWVPAMRNKSDQCGFSPAPAGDVEKHATYNGNLHINGAINGLFSDGKRHSVANGMSTTITAEGDINIINSITYSDYILGSDKRDPNKNNGGAALGLYSAKQNVQLTKYTDNDVNVDAFIITPQGAFQHRDIHSTHSQGRMKMYGGQTTWKGGIGIAKSDGRGGVTGYRDRTYGFDGRGIAPRGFPSFKERQGNVTNTNVNLGVETVVSWSVGLYPPEGTANGNPLENVSFANFGELRQEGAK